MRCDSRTHRHFVSRVGGLEIGRAQDLTRTRVSRDGRVPNDSDIAPSSIGDFFVFIRENDIYRLELRSGGTTRLTHTPAIYRSGTAVSPDGSRIAFTMIEPGRLEQIFLMDADGRNIRRVSRGHHYDFLPRWSPDGQRIAFTSARDGTLGVYSMRVDGTDVRDLSRTPAAVAMQPGMNMIQINETLWAWKG